MAVEANEWLNGSPELMIKAWSPSNRRLRQKADIYIEYGAERVRLVSPETRAIAVVSSEGSTEASVGENVEFQGVPVAVRSIFPKS